MYTVYSLLSEESIMEWWFKQIIASYGACMNIAQKCASYEVVVSLYMHASILCFDATIQLVYSTCMCIYIARENLYTFNLHSACMGKLLCLSTKKLCCQYSLPSCATYIVTSLLQEAMGGIKFTIKLYHADSNRSCNCMSLQQYGKYIRTL